ncbi:MAG: hypothetical protein EXR27_22220 [Betaproteobacteria bacterium]|nr:hypothetical protein [Betaproteobacteria bacterium]
MFIHDYQTQFIRLWTISYQNCRSRAGGNPYDVSCGTVLWVPACAGTTVVTIAFHTKARITAYN